MYTIKNIRLAAIVAILIASSTAFAVTSVIVRHKTSEDLLKGTTDAVVVDSEGQIRLAPKTETLGFAGLLEDIWSVNTVLSDKAGTLYFGTSPAGKIIRFRDGKADLLYPKPAKPDGSTETPDPAAVQQSPQPNEHVYALALDVAGRVLAGISGEKSKLIRIASEIETVFDNEKVQYIFAIVLDKDNNIYLATGPNGQIWQLDPFAQNPRLVCELKDKNILSMAFGTDGSLIAGSDTRGIVYRIQPATGQYTVLFDSDQEEITALRVAADGFIYAAATSANVANQQLQAGASLKKAPGKPDVPASGSPAPTDGGLNLKTPATDEQKNQPAQPPQPAPKAPAPKSAGFVYKISPEGFVTAIFTEPAVFYTLLDKNDKLLLGVGPKARLFSIDPVSEQRLVVYENKTSSQITAAAVDGRDVILALANPASVVRLREALNRKGTYISDLIDAGQPARWGKIQLDADIPDGCKVLLSVRSGNVKDPNDSTFSAWSQETAVTAPVDAACPIGRFCQYRLTFQSNDDAATPVVREVAVAQVIPNLAPRVQAVTAQKADKQKPFALLIQTRAEDDNKDPLEYTIEMRKLGRSNWILIKDKLDQPKYEWDTRTVEDGRYEIRVTVSDRLGNNEVSALTASRVCDPVVIDNTAPTFKHDNLSIEGTTAKLTLSVVDELSVIGKVQYTIDSDTAWKSSLPDDGVYDTTDEQIAIVVSDLKKGSHVLAVCAADDLGNTAYKTWQITID
ncbi:hypothetical protein ACQ9LF_11550 [Anaerohalosphaeraceae bacterium U12dextr]